MTDEQLLHSIDRKLSRVTSTMDMLYHTGTKEGLIPELRKDVKKINGCVKENTDDIVVLKSKTNGFYWLATKIGVVGGVLATAIWHFLKWKMG